MKPQRIIGIKWLLPMLMAMGLASTQAQQDNWIGPATGGEWNTAANWNLGGPPGVATNAFIGVGTNVAYNIAMTATGFGVLTNDGSFNVNAAGFNPTAIMELSPGGSGKFFVNNGGVVSVAGNLALCSNSVASMAVGSSVTLTGTLIIGSDNAGGTGGTATVNGNGSFTNLGGALTVAGVSLNPKNASLGTGVNCRLVIEGGTNNLGAYLATRSPGGNSAPSTLGTDGLVVSNGFVNTTSISIGNNAHGIMYQVGGVVTNTGTFTLKNSTSTRPARYLQVGGLFVDPDPNVIQMNPGGAADTVYAVLGGTNIVGGIQFGGVNTYFTNGGSIYIGSQGIALNGAPTTSAQLISGGLFGATAPWTSSATLTLTTGGGTFTFQTADASGNVNNITLSNPLNGTGSLTVTGGGVLALDAANTYSGNTFVNSATLSLGASGTVTTPKIFVASGATYDVSQVSGYTLNANQQLSGAGAVNGAVIVPSTGVIYPGSNSVTGTLTFTNSLTESGGANNEFNLSSSPTGPGNDFLNVLGGLNLSGVNTVTINGALQSGGVYPLIGYNANLTGGIANLSVTGATGTFSNSVANSIIYFIAQTSVRNPTNITWIGNPTNQNWDVEVTTNWLNTGTSALDYFVPNDTVLFSNLGGSNSQVNIPGGVTVTPTALNVNTTSNYTILGNGAIGGIANLSVSNGTLNVLTTNTYSGVTTLAGGVLLTPLIANSGNPSGIGAASSFGGNVVFNGGTLAYDGSSVGTDHGITLTNSGGTIDVTNGTTLTLNGSLAGNGGLTLIDSGTLTMANINTYTGNTTISNGTLNLNNASGAGLGSIIFAGGTLDLTVGSQPTFANNLTVTANSTMISAGGNNNILSGVWTGASNVTLSVSIASGTFTISGSQTNFLGTVELGNSAGTFRFNATGGSGGDTAFGGQNTTYDLGSNTVTMLARNSDTINLGALEGGSSTILDGQGTAGGTGILNWIIGSNTNNPNTVFAGTIQNSAGNEIATITKVGNGTLTLEGNSTYTGFTAINNGVLALSNNPATSGNGAISGSTNISIAAGAILDVSGRTDDTMPLGSSQILSGLGTINGILDNTGGGIISPGGGINGAIGTLTATNDINLGGTTWMKINRGIIPNSDKLVSSHSFINYGGTLVVTNTGAPLQANDTFTLFSAAGSVYNNSFTLVLPNYYSWDTSQLAVSGSIKVTGKLPPPAITNVDFSGLVSSGNIILHAVNGAPNGAVNILMSTNVAAPLSSWTVVGNSVFDGSGNMAAQITVDQTLPQNFFILEAF